MTPPVPGGSFAGYEVQSSLGRGGMGTVYLVRNTHLDRQEALKALSMDTHGDFAARFATEARTVAKLDHPGIVTVYHHGIENQIPWFTMQYLPGKDLTGTAPLPADDVFTIITKTAEALDYAHRHGVVHRDIKPGNIMVQRDEVGRIERVTILDFGIARLAGATSVTAVGTFIGTLAYSAPETVKDGEAIPASDQYSLASMAFELLTGKAPFYGMATPALLHAQVATVPPLISSRNPAFARLDSVFARAFEKEPSRRYRSCTEFAHALTAATGDTTHKLAAQTPPTAPTAYSAATVRQAPEPTPPPYYTQSAYPPPRLSYTPAPTPPPAPAPAKSNTTAIVLAVVAALLGLGIIGGTLWWLNNDRNKTSTTSTTTAPDYQAPEDSGASEVPAPTSGQVWGFVVSPDGRIINFKNYASRDAMLSAATSEYGYDSSSWGHATFDSGCAAVAHPSSGGGKYYVELADDRSAAESAAKSSAQSDTGRNATVVSSLCVGDSI